MKTEKPIKLKDGSTLPAGLPVQFIHTSPRSCYVLCDRDQPVHVRITSAFIPPGMDEIEAAVCDSVCPSIGGETVEPDGWDSSGAPSWLLALGLI
jgi:hypothetical protein